MGGDPSDEKDDFEMGGWYPFTDYGNKVVIKGISNIIETGYSITIIKGQYSGYTECYSF